MILRRKSRKKPVIDIDFRHAKEQDLDFIMAAESHPENRPFIGQWTREEHQSAISDDNFFPILIVDSNEAPVGYAILAGFENKNRSLELMRLVITEKNKGYGTQSLKMIQEMAFSEFGIHRLWLDVRSHNIRAKTLYEKTGFKVEGLLRDKVLVDSRYESVHILSMLDEEYFSSVKSV